MEDIYPVKEKFTCKITGLYEKENQFFVTILASLIGTQKYEQELDISIRKETYNNIKDKIESVKKNDYLSVSLELLVTRENV